MPCPVPSPTGLPCVKHIPVGWTADEGHGGGHFWMSDKVAALLDGGHYDASALLAGLPATVHAPEDCIPSCPQFWPDRRSLHKSAGER
jgi:hypothetical protein